MNDESLLALAYRTPLEDSLIGISAALSTELSVETVLDHILEQARLFTRAEAGTIYLVESDHLRFAVVQNEPLAVRFGPALARTLPRLAWLETLGRASLPAFCAHLVAVLVVLAFWGDALDSRGWLQDSLLLAAVLLWMLAVARFTQGADATPPEESVPDAPADGRPPGG